MTTLIRTFLAVGGIMLATAVPVLYFAHKRGKPAAIRNFLVSLAVLAFLCGLVRVSSVRLEDNCIKAGNVNCSDYGGYNFVLLSIVGFAITAFVRAWIYFRD